MKIYSAIIVAVLLAAGLCDCSASIGTTPKADTVTVTATPTPTPESTPAPPPKKVAPTLVDNPDPSGYVHFVRSHGGYSAAYVGANLIVKVGESECKALDRGTTLNEIVAATASNGVDPKTKTALIAGAPVYLCQSHAAELRAWAHQNT